MSQLSLIQQAIKLSEEELSLSESGDWTAFAELEKQRSALLEQLDTNKLTEPEAESAREMLHNLISLNAALEKICSEHRQEAMTELKSLRKGATAVQAYKK